MQRLHSSDEDLYNMPQEDLAEAFGTPPTRNNSIKPLRKLSGKKAKKLEKDGTQAQKNKQELMLNRRQNAKAQARKNARAFKELDTTLQVLGINGKQAALEAPAADLQASRKAQKAVSEASSEASEVVGRALASQPSRPHRVQSSQALDGQPKAIPPRIASSPVLPHFASPPLPSQEVLRAQSGEHSFQSELSDLMSARQEWHAVLDDVLEGTHEDLEAIMSSASSKAQDLKEQLIMWQTPPEGTWQARQQRLDWLQLAMSDAKEMFLGLRRHWNLLEHHNRVTEAVDIMKDVSQELSGMASLCCDAVAEGLRSVRASSALDIREGFAMQRSILHVVLKLHHRITTGLVTTNGPALGKALGPPALEVVMAGFEAAMGLQEAVLCPEALTSGLGGQSAHETNARARQLQSCWEECQHATHAITATWPELRTEAHREWCQMYLKAAQLAEAMQVALTPDQAKMQSTSPEAVSHGGGVWGRSPVAECSQAPSVSDEDLQAQAWLPGTLTSMLHLAERAATITLNDSCLVEFQGEEFMGEPDGMVEELIDSMSAAFYSLAATGTVRVGGLCKGPQLLACWALELLEEQACHALMFVRDLDTSLLGQNANGLEQFECLRKCTDELVNAILHVRQLLKRRRFEGPDVPKPAGLRAARAGPSAKPSVQPHPSNQSSSAGKANNHAHNRPKLPSFTGPSGPPNRPPPSPSVTAAAALYRQQPPPLPSRSSQLTASLKGNSVSTPNGQQPSGTTSSWQQQMANAANRSATQGSSAQAAAPPKSSPMLSQKGFSTPPDHAASAASQQSSSVDRSLQPLAEDSAFTFKPQSRLAGLPSASEQSVQSISKPECRLGQPQAAPQANGHQLVKPSYASKVASHAQADPPSPAPDPSSKVAVHAHSEQKGTRQKQRHSSRGRGQDRGRGRPSVDAAPAISSQDAATSSAESSRPVQAPSSSQHQSPFASQKSLSFGRHAEAAVASEHSSPAAAPPQLQSQLAQHSNANSIAAQSPIAAHKESQHEQSQQHPPFREPVLTSNGHASSINDDNQSSQGGTESSLGAENRDPTMSQEEARAAAERKTTAAQRDLLASPFKMSNIETLPSFTKPLPASKYKEFPSSRSSHTMATPDAAEAAQASSSQVPHQPRSASPHTESAASRAEGTDRATAPPAATDNTGSHADNRPGSSPRAEADGLNRLVGRPGPTSPRTPLPLPEVSQSELSFNQSSSTSGPMAGYSHSDSGFSLLWDDDPFWQLCWDKIKPTLVTKLGQGSFGQVYEGWYHSAPMAVKIMNNDRCTGLTSRALQLFKEEVDLQRKLSFHPNIVRFIGACCQIPRHLLAHQPPHQQHHQQALQAVDVDVCNVTLAIVMELCRLGSFYKLIEQARKVSSLPWAVRTGAKCPSNPEEAKAKASPGFRLYGSWSLRLELARQAAAAVEFMHSHNVVHRDLTSNNLLVTDKWEAKVCDFNLARALKSETVEPSRATLNSPAWSAPERLQGKRYGKAADVFSFGVILWELLTLGVPWRDMADDGSVDDVRDNFYYVLNNVIQGNHLPCPRSVEPLLPELPQVVALIEACWTHNPEERPNMTEVAETMHDIVSTVKRRVRADHQSRPAHTTPHD